MNAFENIVALYLEEEGYWVRQSVKVEKISKDDKKVLGNSTMPRPEIDIVALNMKRNELVFFEVKSFLHSQGVYFDVVKSKEWEQSKHYRLFNDEKYRNLITTRLLEAYMEKGLANRRTKVNYGLAAGKIHTGDKGKFDKHFANRGWVLITPEEIKSKVKTWADKGWEDNVVFTTAKLICGI
ncbi:MAG: hypothetical protein C4555_03075 [Dehalococcoidia bacterium]|nr:MAG: hypothetical protein C4555_03075 [Dehalococcoidia bacterium]